MDDIEKTFGPKEEFYFFGKSSKDMSRDELVTIVGWFAKRADRAEKENTRRSVEYMHLLAASRRKT